MTSRRRALMFSKPRTVVGTFRYGLTSTATLYDDGAFEVEGIGDGQDFTTVPWNTYMLQIKKVVFSDDITSVSSRAFRDCANLVSVKLPSNLTKMVNSCFKNCTNLVIDELPRGVISIAGSAFYGCTSIESLIFNGTPNSISTTSFVGCNNLLNIYVPWSEGEVANAP